jgi:hypothetical protein
MSEQTRLVEELQALVRQTVPVSRTERRSELLCLPTGDGMLLVFLRNPVAPVECAVELARAVRQHPALQIRMGVHSGPVQRVEDINSSQNVSGTAVNLAQRVMNCGDGGHILLSRTAADFLRQAGLWVQALRDLGVCTVKHGERVHLFNLCGEDFGNPAVPVRLLHREASPDWAPQPGAPVALPTAADGSRREDPPPPNRAGGGCLVSWEKLEPAGGAVPLESQFYVVRASDAAFSEALDRRDSIVLVKGARQMGKTSLLARGLQRVRQAGAKVVLNDFQKLNLSDLESAERLFLSLADAMAEQLNLELDAGAHWNVRRGPSVNFERFLRRHVLSAIAGPLVWGLDEVDRLFSCCFASDVFGLFRSWHNERALDPEGPWSRLTLVIAYATEAHLFITDVNQSPFNVGTRLALQDFTFEQVADLNQRHGEPLRSEAEVARLFRLVGGQPFLVRQGLREMVTQGLDIETFEGRALQDDGLFGDHLRRMLVLLGQEPHLGESVVGVLRGRSCPSLESFYRLRSAGLLAGESPHEARPRCQLYAIYLERHLL